MSLVGGKRHLNYGNALNQWAKTSSGIRRTFNPFENKSNRVRKSSNNFKKKLHIFRPNPQVSRWTTKGSKESRVVRGAGSDKLEKGSTSPLALVQTERIQNSLLMELEKRQHGTRTKRSKSSEELIYKPVTHRAFSVLQVLGVFPI